MKLEYYIELEPKIEPEEGGPCPELNCDGKLEYGLVEDCYCHLTPPCHRCLENPLVCTVCYWEDENV